MQPAIVLVLRLDHLLKAFALVLVELIANTLATEGKVTFETYLLSSTVSSNLSRNCVFLLTSFNEIAFH